jgi:hypothetical protein
LKLPIVMALTFRYLQRPSEKKQRKFLASAKRRLLDVTRIEDDEILMLHAAADLEKNPERTILSSTLPNPFWYWLFEMPQDAIDHVLGARARHFFYQIEGGRPVRCYMDIERPRSAADQLLDNREACARFVATCRRLIAYFCCFVDAVFLCSSNLYYDAQWYLYSASTDVKMSVHAHSNLLFRDVDQLCTVQNSFIAALRSIGRHDPTRVAEFFHEGKCILDGSVLTPRPFRLAFNAKRACDSNHLMPVDDDEQHRALTDREHLAQCFVHPMPTLHGAHIAEQPPMPEWPAPGRMKLLARLLDEPQWPCASLHELDAIVWAACALPFKAECADRAPIAQLFDGSGGDDDSVRAAAVRIFAEPMIAESVAPLRAQWLAAIATIIEVGHRAHERAPMRYEDELVPFLGALVASAGRICLQAMGGAWWPERLVTAAGMVGIDPPVDPSALQPEPGGTDQPPDLRAELAFCLFGLRTAAYDSKPNPILLEFLRESTHEWPAHMAGATLERAYARFGALPCALFGTDEHRLVQMEGFFDQRP